MPLFRFKRKEHTTSNVCPRTELCPLFRRNASNGGYSSVKYRELYCEAGIKAYSNCKRYIIYHAIDSCPDYVMPNSSFSIEEIISRINKQPRDTNNL